MYCVETFFHDQNLIQKLLIHLSYMSLSFRYALELFSKFMNMRNTKNNTKNSHYNRHVKKCLSMVHCVSHMIQYSSVSNNTFDLVVTEDEV